MISCDSADKESACNAGDPSSKPGLRRSPREGNSYPLQYSCLENSMDCIIHGVTKSWTWLSNFHFHSVYKLNKVKSHVQLFGSPWTASCQAPLSMEFSRQEYWSGCCSLLQGIFPTQGLNFEPRFPLLQVDSLPAEPPGKPWTSRVHEKMKLKPKPNSGYVWFRTQDYGEPNVKIV